MSTTHFAARVALLLAIAAWGSGCGKASKTPENGQESETAEEEHERVRLDSTAIAVSRISVISADTVRTTSLPVTGTITYDANRLSHVGARVDGRIVQITVDLGASVVAGQTLAVLESAEVGQVRADEGEAAALVDIARENFERERRLQSQGISSRKEMLDAEADLRRAEAALNSARQRLQVLGTEPGQGGRFALTAPFAGVVVARHATLGEVSTSSGQLFTVANLDRLWIELDLYERDLARVRRGQAVRISTAAYPGRVFPGTIAYVGDILEPEKRTVRVRVEIPNPSRILKPGMFANAQIDVDEGGAPFVVIPEDAVQRLPGRTVVFVPGTTAGEFLVRTVELGAAADSGRVVVLSGLAAGERLVSTGAFALRSELARSEIGEAGHGH